ncbi:S9 family peptidase [Nonomuraea roseoviolacea]|uniref:Dipeptidyl aminopeptidase/acylaminoacyl peptidase n=1 Tax=Nonomuraea roseoviolacea subsp. carminata TaxID=160689 RepID=A0ABT1JT13_9ACTN|nr:prolyl oligopeptidase family serine peptidase [Nonomuraea roseoviolacea]MCP2344891.1 dipeptidyl aminopeptidase/acylaminoacyl peptidase [Nonomuraea roseoviolacea subsp. carminata]
MPFWPSPVSTTDVARSGRRPSWPVARDGQVWWTEDRPDEGGRTTIVRRAADGTHSELLAAPWCARTRVHEYGGRPYAVTPAGEVVFCNLADQRLYRGHDDPVPLTPAGDGSRYADLLVRDGRVWCVRERHHDGKVTRSVVSFALDAPGDMREHVTGADFYAFPALSPDGRHLAFVCWDHPLMPWDGTELRVARLSDGATWTVAGGPSESVLAPQWKDDDYLYLVSDRSGWWNLHEAPVHGGPSRALHPAGEEFAGPLWRLGGMPYTVLGDGRLAVLHGRGDLRLGLLDPRTGALRDLDAPCEGWDPALAADGGAVIGVGYGPTAPRTVLRVDTATGGAETLARDAERLPDPAWLPSPRAVELPGREGRRVHARLYPPTGGDPGAAPPYVVFVHGGPTAHAGTALDLEKALLTSRGIGVLDVDYGGSTGYGRAYRELLRGRWGVVDVEDVVAAAEWLATEGLADPARVAVRGGSAGGWTVMAACCRSGVFAGGVSYYGVSALAPLVTHTHDFESRYVEWLVGPEDPALYATREPLALVGGVTCPMLLLQGLDDPIVPPEQSAAFADALAERGVPCTYLAFEGESHGFRRAETRATALAAELAFYQQIFS